MKKNKIHYHESNSKFMISKCIIFTKIHYKSPKGQRIHKEVFTPDTINDGVINFRFFFGDGKRLMFLFFF